MLKFFCVALLHQNVKWWDGETVLKQKKRESVILPVLSSQFLWRLFHFRPVPENCWGSSAHGAFFLKGNTKVARSIITRCTKLHQMRPYKNCRARRWMHCGRSSVIVPLKMFHSFLFFWQKVWPEYLDTQHEKRWDFILALGPRRAEENAKKFSNKMCVIHVMLNHDRDLIPFMKQNINTAPKYHLGLNITVTLFRSVSVSTRNEWR